jgi:acetyl esterase/lipase
MAATDHVREHNEAAMDRFRAQQAEFLALQVPNPHEERVIADLEFARPDGHPLLLDLYLPQRPVGLAPLIVWIHGGGWMIGDRGQVPPVIGQFAARGLAVASIEYRLSGQAIFPAQLDDVRSAVRWLREHGDGYGVDPWAIGLWGSSAGAHLAALAATSAREEADRVQAVCDGYGPTRLQDMDAQRRPQDVIHGPRGSAEGRLLGVATGDASPELLHAADPIAHVTSDAPPFLIVHGTDDLLVPAQQSIDLHDRLVAARVESTLCLLDDMPHGLLRGNLLNRRPAPEGEIRTNAGTGHERSDRGPVTFELIERFFDRHLRRDPWNAA